jgi:hypothetical protein
MSCELHMGHYQNTRTFLLLRNYKTNINQTDWRNMFCLQSHRLSMVFPSKFRLVQLRIYTCYTKTCFFSLVLPVIFPELLTSGQLYYSDVMILFNLYIIVEQFLKL